MSSHRNLCGGGVFPLAILGIASLVWSAEIQTGDGQPDGKKSLGGSGEIIGFTLPADSNTLTGIRIHGSRYGAANPPDEKFLIYLLNDDMTEIISTQMAPYALFERGPEKWVTVNFAKPVSVSKRVWVAVDFRAGRNKGVYVSFDSSTDGKESRIGLPGTEIKQPDFKGDWMIEAIIP